MATENGRRPVVGAVLAAALVVLGVGLGVPRPALAQTATNCPLGGPGAIQIDITEPADGARVSGVIPVRGRAQASLGVEITQIEISLGKAAAGGGYVPRPFHTFDYRLDTTRLVNGPTTLRVVACNRRELGGLIARGTREITVIVEDAEGGAAEPRSTTSGAPTTASTEAAGDSEVEGTAEEAPEEPLFLSDAPADEEPDRPIWVGVVVGISGAVGLLIAAVSWRRRGPAFDDDLAAEADPDPDLVSVE